MSHPSVLLVDDDHDYREALGEVLRREGCTVLEAENGRCALEMLRWQVPDIIVTDLRMPIMNGIELVAALREDAILRSVPVTIIAAAGPGPEPTTHLQVQKKPIDLEGIRGLLSGLGPR